MSDVAPGDRVVILRDNDSGSNWLRPGALATVDYLLPDYGKVICRLDEPVGGHTGCCLYDSQFNDHWGLASNNSTRDSGSANNRPETNK